MTRAQANRAIVSEALGWSAEQFATFLFEGTVLLHRYREADIGTDDRGRVVVEMEGALRPLQFHSRVEPRQTLIETWRNLHEAFPVAFKESVLLILRRVNGRLSYEQLDVFLSLLVGANATLPSEVAFTALDALLIYRASANISGGTVRIIELMGGEGRGIVSLLERLSHQGALTVDAFYAAARRLASWDPFALRWLFGIFGLGVLNTRDLCEDDLRFVLNDLVSRAGPFAVLDAICILDPRACAPLFRAAFAGTDSPFAVRQISAHGPDARQIEIIAGEQSYAISLLEAPSQDEEWALKIRSVTRTPPQIAVRHLAIDADIGHAAELDASGNQTGSLASLVRDQLQVSVTELEDA